MSDLAFASIVLLWIGFFVLLGVNVIIIRQLGILFERVAPAGALATSSGLSRGQIPTSVIADTLSGLRLHLPLSEGSVAEKVNARLIVFIAPSCDLCKKIVPLVQSISHETATPYLFASAGFSAEKHKQYAQQNELDFSAYVISDELGMRWGIGKLPYAVLLDLNGAVVAHGLVNSREHLESLFEAKDQNVASLQDYIERQNLSDQAPPLRGESDTHHG